jgi:hypothetical protein
MSFWKLVKGINFKQIIRLGTFLLQHPIFMLATIKATSKTMKIVQEEFPDIHGKDNKANAFRHALWNCLIAFQCAKNEKDIVKVIFWTKKITDWHEDFSPNLALARAMDLHNNYIGRELFQYHKNKKEKEVIRVLQFKLASAVQVNSLSELEMYQKNLVFINND